MKKISLVIMLFLFLTSCSSSTENAGSLPENVLETDEAFEKLFGYITSHYSNLDKSNIEVMSFDYSASVGVQKEELSSNLSISFVKGSDKNVIVEYNINNEGIVANNIVDISVGDMFNQNQKLSNTYETYQPYLFSGEKINLEVLRKIMQESLEAFKKDANVEKAYCSSINIEIKEEKVPRISVGVAQYKFASTLRRSYNYTTDGKLIK